MMNSWLAETVKRNERRGDIVEINPADATAKNIVEDQDVTIRSRTGALKVKARITEAVPPGIVSMDHGWGVRLFDPQSGAAEVQGVNRNQLIAADVLDELTGVPNLTGSYVNVQAA